MKKCARNMPTHPTQKRKRLSLTSIESDRTKNVASVRTRVCFRILFFVFSGSGPAGVARVGKIAFLELPMRPSAGFERVERLVKLCFWNFVRNSSREAAHTWVCKNMMFKSSSHRMLVKLYFFVLCNSYATL